MGFEELLNPSRLLTFFFMFIRISGIMFTAPIFSSNALNNMIRMILSIMVSLILIPTIPLLDITDLNTLWLILVAFKELLIGVVIGAMTSLLFSAIQLGGYLIDYQMGFSMVSVIDPTSDASISFTSQVYNILASLVYLAIYGHHIFLRAVASSFEFLPLINFPFEENALMYVISTFIRVFIVAVQITAPIFIALMIVNAVMGVMARLVPQINLMIVGFPLKIAIGAVVLILSLRLFYIVFEKIMYEYFRAISTFFEKMGAG